MSTDQIRTLISSLEILDNQTKIPENNLIEYTSTQVQTNKPIAWADKFLTDLYPLKSSLNPKFWTKKEMLQPQVREAMLAWADRFIREMRISKERVVDIQFKGSLANYVYHSESDIDLHIIIDKVSPNKEIAAFTEKQRKYFNDTNHYTIYGFPVEFFIKTQGEVQSSDAVYSVLHGEWVHKPRPVRNKKLDDIKKFFVPWYNSILDAYNITLSQTKNKEAAMKAGLNAFQIPQNVRNEVLDGSPGAEYKSENLAFKALKRTKLFLFLQSEKRRFNLERQTVK